MKYKNKTLDIKRARSEKMMRQYYYGYLLPLTDGLIAGKPFFNNN